MPLLTLIKVLTLRIVRVSPAGVRFGLQTVKEWGGYQLSGIFANSQASRISIEAIFNKASFGTSRHRASE